MLFNVNHQVRVKLTPRGLQIHREQHERMCRFWGKELPYTSPETDANGWSEWQLWVLMQTFGPFVENGLPVPFETEIEIIERP